MPVTKVKTNWNAGKLEFKDSTGSVLFTIDSTAKSLDFLFAKLDVSGGSTEATLGAKQVTSGVLSSGAVLGPKIKADAVSSKHIAGSAITSGLIAASAVLGPKIKADAVSSAHIAASAITSGLIAALAVKAAKVAASAVASSAIAAEAVIATKIKDDTLDGQHPAIIPDNDTIPGIPIQFVIKTTAVSTAAAATTTTLKAIAVTEALRVIDLWVVQTSGPGASSNFTIRVRKGVNAISNAMGCKTADFSILRPTALGNNTNRKFAVGSTIQIRGANASSKAVKSVYVMIRAVKSS